MHPLVEEALHFAARHVTCDAAREPPLEGLRQALLEARPSASETARLSELLQASLHIAETVCDATTRLLDWAQEARQAATVNGRPKAALCADLRHGLSISLESPDCDTAVGEYAGRALNTVLFLRADEFIANTAVAPGEEHWAIRQARFQACGVLSRSLRHLQAALATVADMEVRSWPVYRRTGDVLELELSLPQTRAGVWLRERVAGRLREQAQAQACVDQALQRIGLRDLAHWKALRAIADENPDALRAAVRDHGLPSATHAQLRAAALACIRQEEAERTLAASASAALELRALAGRSMPPSLAGAPV